MRKSLFLWGGSLVFLLLMSCEKTLNITLSNDSASVVIEGTIQTGQPPYVYLTNSVGFFDKIDLNSIQYIQGATVQVTDIQTAQSITLKQYTIDTVIGPKTFSFTVYGPDVNDPQAMAYKGQIEHTYRLQVNTGGKTYTSFTKIPKSNGLDSVWTEPVPGREDSFSILKARYIDPDTFGNAVKVQTLVHKYIKTGDPEIFLTSFNSVYNDDIINGTALPVTIDIGYDKNKNYSREDFQTLGYLRHGDTVTLQWSAIDGGVYHFWETMSYSAGTIGNPFASPIKIQSNIPGALGVWAGYNPTFYTLVDTLK